MAHGDIECKDRCFAPEFGCGFIMSRLRTFIAVPLNRAVPGRLNALQERLAGKGADVEWVEPENLHVTLLFLGEVGERDVMPVCRAVADVCRLHTPFSFGVETVGCFPN